MLNLGKGQYLLWAFVGGYLMYLGAKLLIELFQGTSRHVALSGAFGTLFVVAGALVILREWKRWRIDRMEKDARDDEM